MSDNQTAATPGAVLMLDDDETDALLARRCFRETGIDADFVWFDQATHLIRHLESASFVGEAAPKGILLDVNLYAISGFKVLQIIRSMPRYAHEPDIIILTHSDSQQDRERAVELGANGFLTKPDSIDAYIEFFRSRFA